VPHADGLKTEDAIKTEGGPVAWAHLEESRARSPSHTEVEHPTQEASTEADTPMERVNGEGVDVEFIQNDFESRIADDHSSGGRPWTAQEDETTAGGILHRRAKTTGRPRMAEGSALDLEDGFEVVLGRRLEYEREGHIGRRMAASRR
jgi:hypothetical protein